MKKFIFSTLVLSLFAGSAFAAGPNEPSLVTGANKGPFGEEGAPNGYDLDQQSHGFIVNIVKNSLMAGSNNTGNVAASLTIDKANFVPPLPPFDGNGSPVFTVYAIGGSSFYDTSNFTFKFRVRASEESSNPVGNGNGNNGHH